MSNHQHTIESQIALIEKAMQEAGVWSNSVPSWVHTFGAGPIPDIWQWMQYIYLPMRLKGISCPDQYLAPIIEPYLRNTNYALEILQLIIELDALTPVFQKTKMQPQ